MSANSGKLFSGLMVFALALILGGGFLASMIQTGGGYIEVKDVRYVGQNGKLVSALLYIPKGVDQKNPAPGNSACLGS